MSGSAHAHPVESKIFPKIPCKVVINGIAKTTFVSESIKGLPLPFGRQHTAVQPSSISKGLGRDNMAACSLESVSCENALLTQQMAEMQDIHASLYQVDAINPTVLKISCLDVHKSAATCCVSVLWRLPLKQKSHCMRSWQCPKKKLLASQQCCVVTINGLTPNKLKSRIGFYDAKEMLKFAAVVCAGDVSMLSEKSSYLSSYKEWFLYFEIIYGHSAICWEDYEHIYKKSQSVLHQVFEKKLAFVKAMRT